MTDYLELLLEEQESEKESPASDWKRRTFRPVNAEERAGGRSEVEAVSFAGYTQNKLGTAQPERTADEEIPLETELRQTRDMTVELLRLRRAVRQAQTGNGHSVEKHGGTLGGDTGFLWMGGKSDVRTADYAALVDMAFARDARRYDGLPGLL